MSVRNAGKQSHEARIKAGLTQNSYPKGYVLSLFSRIENGSAGVSPHISSTYGSCGCSLRSLPDLCKQNRSLTVSIPSIVRASIWVPS